METSTNSAAAPARPLGNHILKHNYSHSHHTHSHHHSSTLSSTSILIIIISAICAIVILAIFMLIVMLKRLKSAKNVSSSKDNSSINNKTCWFVADTTVSFTSSPDVKEGCLYGSNMSQKPPRKHKGVQVFTYKELEVATDRFSEANVIGNGGYGVVYKSVLADGTLAAIKMFRREGKQGERAFRIEVDLLSRLHSPYLVELLGYCADQHHRLLIFEFMPNGTLQYHLHHKQYQPLDWGTRLRIALDCARALEFLHENTIPAVIHRDFKCSNILLDQNFRAKVSDFGFAKMGMLQLLLTGRIPVDTKRPPGEHVLVSWALPRLTNREKVVEMVDPVLRGNYSKKDLIQVAAIAAMCVQPEADYRPLMTDVVQSLIPLVKNLSSVSSSASSRFHNHVVSPRS
ncbi:conserved hypothetical protein [Ricinus communis]|uniref:Protein kinase domain-containing protein n=1 Tax=Ricinus communis TaxID=3988 RepID=B9RF26_RICCO|nr:conserved hypothetical protein [Ricinus communis]